MMRENAFFHRVREIDLSEHTLNILGYAVGQRWVLKNPVINARESGNTVLQRRPRFIEFAGIEPDEKIFLL